MVLEVIKCIIGAGIAISIYKTIAADTHNGFFISLSLVVACSIGLGMIDYYL